MITDGVWIEYIPLPDTLPLGEKHSGTKLAVGSATYRGSHSSLSADVFLRSGAGNTFNPRPCNSLQYINVTPIPHAGAGVALLTGGRDFSCLHFLFVQQPPARSPPDEPATSGGVAT